MREIKNELFNLRRRSCTKQSTRLQTRRHWAGGLIVHEEGITIDRETDNAELELLALIEGLEYAEDGDVIYSDSEYCVKGFNLWLDGWKKKGWRRADRKQIKNRRLWQTVDALRADKYVEVEKVRAHSGVRGNEAADSLAVDAARSDIG